MRKIIPSILITLILANIFAPFSFEVKKGALSVKQNVAEAKFATGTFKITKKTKNSIDVYFELIREESDGKGAFLLWSKEPFNIEKIREVGVLFGEDILFGEGVGSYKFDLRNATDISLGDDRDKNTFKHTVTQLEEDTTYYLVVAGFSGSITNKNNWYISNNLVGKTTTGDNVDVTETSTDLANSDFLPSCGIGIGGGTIMGCVARIVYYVVFGISSGLFGLGGMFFDEVFNYSIQSTTYDNDFVLNGWGMVRDFVNMFFIFILLYIAISTILNTHGFKTKEMIINVVIIGLLINFSLFATQVIIDASNILARVFYNSETIKISKKGDDNKITYISPEPNGTIPISEALVSKVDVQKFVVEAKKANLRNAADKMGGDSDSLGTGTFIFITLLISAVCIVGFIVFLSVGLMLIGRVVGLWIAMILAPFAFFSYTVPAMQSWEFVGWKHWWSDTLKMAFLAPIFIFFLYLIIGFLGFTGSAIGDAAGKTGWKFLVSILVPFVFLMVLLWQAKSIAKTMSGKLGQSITGGVAAIGGMALGGAALGTAFLGRNIVGRGMAAMSKSDGAKKLDTYHQQLKDFNAGRGPHPGNKPKVGIMGQIGHRLNRSQRKVDEVDHAKHEVDDIKKKAGLEGVSNANLSAVDKEKMQKVFTKEKRSEIESDLRSGRKGNLIDQTGRNWGQIGEDGYKSAKRRDETNAYLASQGRPMSHINSLTDEDKKNIENRLNQKFNETLQLSLDKESANRLSHLQTEAKSFVSAPERIFAGSNKASYDARNLSQIKSDGRGGFKSFSWLTKASVALTAAAAMLLRTSLKQGGVSHGVGQGDFFKDLKNTFEEAIKNAKINVKVESSGGHGGGHDDHGGGHGGGHH